MYRCKFLGFTFAGIVIRFFTACPFCFGFSDNGNGTSLRKGMYVSNSSIRSYYALDRNMYYPYYEGEACHVLGAIQSN